MSLAMESIKNPLDLDLENEASRIATSIQQSMRDVLHRRGLIIAMSGGIDSSVCAALAVRALGAKKVYGLLMPEQDSSGDSLIRGRELAEHLGINYCIEDIAPTLEAIGCYRWRDDAIRGVFPDYQQDWKNKIAISGGTEGKINHFKLIVENTQGVQFSERLPLGAYLTIVAATNNKQRIRKSLEYFHADRLNYAVTGTPNRLEYDQGFFVKNGDGSADVKPIAHLYKTQVYALARHLKLPESICSAIPTTDTYSLEQGQDEFYFSLPYEKMDLALWSKNHDIDPSFLAKKLDISTEQAQWIYDDIDHKRKTTRYQHAAPCLVEEIKEIRPDT